MPRENRFIMYTCGPCSEHNGEACGYYERDDLRVMPDGMWVCDSCYDEEREDDTLMWSALPIPPEYGPIAALEAQLAAMTRERDALWNVYHMAFHALDDSETIPGYLCSVTGPHGRSDPLEAGAIIINSFTNADALLGAMDAYEAAFPERAHGAALTPPSSGRTSPATQAELDDCYGQGTAAPSSGGGGAVDWTVSDEAKARIDELDRKVIKP